MAYAVSGLLVLGALFMLLASYGVLRLGDVFLRLHAATKAGTLGKILLISAVALAFGDLSVTARSLLIVLFFFATAPVASHLLARAAYALGVLNLAEANHDDLAERLAREPAASVDEESAPG